MNQYYLDQLTSFCNDFAVMLANTADGKGTSLHDIKNSFDYVLKSIDKLEITGEGFEQATKQKIKQCNDALSSLWHCVSDLKKALENFVQEQKQNNNTTFY